MESLPSSFGLLRIGDYQFALPVAALQQVMIRPATTPLADPGPLATGTFLLGGTLLPALDLLPLLTGIAAPPQERRLLAVVRHADVLLGLEVDRIHKVVNTCEEEFSQLHSAADAGNGNGELFPHQFWDPETERAVGVLNPDALLQRKGVRWTRRRSGGEALRDTLASRDEAGTQHLHLALFQAQGRTFGVEMRCVQQALHAAQIAPGPACGDVLYGHFRTEQGQIPILRLSELLGLPSQNSGVPSQRGLVLQAPVEEGSCPEAPFGLLIENVVGALQASLRCLHSLAASGMARPYLYRGLLSTEDFGSVLILDAAALSRELGQARPAAQSVSAARDKASAPLATGGEVAVAETPFVVYRAGGRTLASALTDLEAVVPRAELCSLGQPGELFLGVIRWRSHMVNLLDLSVLLDQRNSSADIGSDVLITQADGRLYGLLVSQVESLASGSPQPSPALSRPVWQGILQGRGAALCTDMIEIRTGTVRRNVTVLPVRELIRALEQPGQTL